MLSHGELQLSLLLPMWRTARQTDRGIDLDYVSIFYNRFKQPVMINTYVYCGKFEREMVAGSGNMFGDRFVSIFVVGRFTAVTLLSIIRSLFCCQLYFLNVNLLLCDVSGCLALIC